MDLIHLILVLALNFKILFILFFFISLPSCGVKGDPIVPKETYLPSVESQYLKRNTDKKLDKESEENKKEDKKENLNND